MSTPPQEPHRTTPPPTSPLGAAQTVLSVLGQASGARETLTDSPTSAGVLGTAQSVLSRMASSSTHPLPENTSDGSTSAAVLGAAQSMFSRLASPSVPHPIPENPSSDSSTSVAVLGAAQNVLSRLASSSAPQATLQFKPVPEIPGEHAAPEAPVSPDVPQRAADPNSQRPTSVSSHGGGSGGRAHTPPRGATRVTRSYPALPEIAHHPRPAPITPGVVYRRSAGPYPDSETAWHAPDEPYREKTVGQRMHQTIVSATGEHIKATQKATWTGWVQNIAMGLQILIGALTTGLGAALSGKSTSVAISILGGASTLVASYLARTKGSNEPQVSLLRAQALDHFLREIEAFVLDHGHEVGGKWDEKINGFRFGLERILGNHPGSLTISPDRYNSGREKGIGDDPGAGLGGSGKYPMSGTTAKPGYMV